MTLNIQEIKAAYSLKLVYMNDFLSIERFAEYYGISVIKAEEIIKEGEKVQQVINVIYELSGDIENFKNKPWLSPTIRSHISHGAWGEHETIAVDAALEIVFNK